MCLESQQKTVAFQPIHGYIKKKLHQEFLISEELFVLWL